MKPTFSPEAITILIVEDEPAVRENILEILELEGFKPLSAENGLQAFEMARIHCPNLIICDVMMPEMDGFQLMRRLQQAPDTQLIPVIFLTAKSSMTDLREGMNLGADDYLTKPFTRTDILSAIHTRLAKRKNVNNLEAKIQGLQQVNLLKDEILSSVSHDLKGPLTNMKIAIQMLNQDRLTPEQRKRYLDILQAECLRETNLVNALLDWQKVESGAYNLNVDTLQISDLIKTLVESFQARATLQNQQLRLELSDQLPPLQTDRMSLERILSELLNNACKYTSTGGEIEIGVLTQSIDKKLGIQILIKNSAQIPAEALPLLFDPFYRIKDSHRQEGTGLGLAIVKSMVQRLKGSISVDSQEGWTTFSLVLPL